MVAPICSNRKGIYKDLYREIDANNKKKEKAEKASQFRNPRKGIYVEMYRQIEFKNNERKNKEKNLYALAFKKFVSDIFSKVIYFFSAATGDIKMLIVAFMFVKKPIGNYIENNMSNYLSQEQNLGIYQNDR